MRLHPTLYVGRLKSYLPSGSADPTGGDSVDQRATEDRRLVREASQLGRLKLALSVEPLKNVNRLFLHGLQRNDTSFELAAE